MSKRKNNEEKMVKSFTHNFLFPFEYITKGEKAIAKSITVQSPSNAIWQHVVVLDSAHAKSQRDAMTNSISAFGGIEKMQAIREKYEEKINETDKDDNELALDIVSGILASGEGGKCFMALLEILKSGNTEFPTALIDDVEKVTKPIFDKMNPNDTKIILGRYIESFLDVSPAN